MRKVLLAIAATVVLSTTDASANHLGLTANGFVLVPIGNISEVGWKTCGPYFIQSTQNHFLEIAKVAFRPTVDESTRFRKFDREYFSVVVDRSITTPVASYFPRVDRADPLEYHIVVLMNEYDAAEAQPCLPAPGFHPAAI